MGGVIVYKAFTIQPRSKPDEYHGPRVSWLGLLGGFCDAIGGGGWGPVVTSTLVARGKYATYDHWLGQLLGVLCHVR
jgi:uncharacterized protein